MEETQTVDINDINRELYDLKNKYERLKEGHRKLLIVNQNLEEKVNNYQKYLFGVIICIVEMITVTSKHQQI